MRKSAVFIEKVKFQYGRVWAGLQLAVGEVEGEETEAEEREQDQQSGKGRKRKKRAPVCGRRAA